MPLPGSFNRMRLQHREKSLGLMLLLAFSAALFGVMAVQKLREKSVLNVLLKEKDKELSAFQMLLQEKRDEARDFEKMTEEMKDTINTLSSQKRDLNGWILEMESTVSSLKENNQAMASVLEEKAKEIKELRDREFEMSQKESEEASLREIVRMKQEEIEDLTQRLRSSTQESYGRKENVASPHKRESWNKEQNGGSSDENDQDKGSQDNTDNSSQDQQQLVVGGNRGNSEVVHAGESNGAVDRGDTGDSDKLLAQPARHNGAQISRKRSRRWRVIARNRRTGKRGDRRIIRLRQEDQSHGGNVEVQSTTKTDTMNQVSGSTGFNHSDESGRFQSKVDVSFDRIDENRQDMEAHGEAASNTGQVTRAEEEHRHGVKQPQPNDDARLNNSADQREDGDTLEVTANDGNTPIQDETAQMENADSVKGTNMDTLEVAVNPGNLRARDEAQTENKDSVESTDDGSRETELEDTKQYEAKNKWNSFEATPEENEEQKVDEPEF
ncbi:hypothetical protein MLD38_025835 [Melastoma candidum]|uniref:Uncharacterized protein n=1 Tax=Melastoma candidum TaxID=119954 RepID=A0ACB9P054_9MYRT|nr:hypothetical protein MLD38_025835 [Melastoma candidum]